MMNNFHFIFKNVIEDITIWQKDITFRQLTSNNIDYEYLFQIIEYEDGTPFSSAWILNIAVY